jgi:membrane protein implicated in regulation of membrane protease activity
MLERSSTAVLFVAGGVVLIVIGLLVWSGALSWFGRLPGDIRVERPGTRFYAPITSMIIVSVILTLVLSLIQRFWR